jgi:peroxin-5
MLQELANSADCAVGPTGVNPLKALADAVDGSSFHAAHGTFGGERALDHRADGASASAHAQYDSFAAQFGAAQPAQPHPVLQRAWAQSALRKAPAHAHPAALDGAWAAAEARAPAAPALGAHAPARALADFNPAMIECFRALAHGTDALTDHQQLHHLAVAASSSLPPAERARAAGRAATHARLALGARAQSLAGGARLRALVDGLSAPQLTLEPTAAERAHVERLATDFAAARVGGVGGGGGGDQEPSLAQLAGFGAPPFGGGGLAASFWASREAARGAAASDVPAHAAALDRAAAAAAEPAAAATARAPSAPSDAARQLSAPMIAAMEAAALNDPRFERSELLSFLRQVHDGAIDLDDEQFARADAAASAAAATAAATATAAAAAAGYAEGAAAQRPAANAAQAARAQRAWVDALSGDVADGSLFDGLWDSLRVDDGDGRAGARDAPRVAEGARLPAAVERAMAAAAGRLGGDARAAPPPYEFSASNPFASEARPLETANRLAAQGELAAALLAAEAAAACDGLDSRAWLLLGQLHADCDDDAAAIVALRHALAADASNGAARLLLGVSCTNQLDQSSALHQLREWLVTHPDPALAALAAADARPADADAAADAASALGGGDPFGLHDRLTALFRAAAAQAPADADVHAVLGVLYNLSLEYGAAIAAFETAVRLRPNDSSLWNKLGATCANAMRPDQALAHYVRALELRPDYVRALTNLGISYGNLGRPMEGAACYLRALELNPRGTHIWGYLTMLFHTSGRPELADRAASRDVEAFRGLVDF